MTKKEVLANIAQMDKIIEDYSHPENYIYRTKEELEGYVKSFQKIRAQYVEMLEKKVWRRK